MIIGRDLMKKIGINFEDLVVEWKNALTPMKSRDILLNMGFLNLIEEEFYESKRINESTAQMTRILDAHYNKADLYQITEVCIHLIPEQRLQLRQALLKYEYLFSGILGMWQTSPIELELQPNVRPYHAKPYMIPKCYGETLKKECG